MEKEFNKTALRPPTDFDSRLVKFFDAETHQSIISVLCGLQLPLPDTTDTFMSARDGALLFLDRYGIVIRIEKKPYTEDGIISRRQRMNNSAWILQPLASFDVGKAILEICPGCSPAADLQQCFAVRDGLAKENIKYWDVQLVNTGLLPFKTSGFPDGIPVVIDRLSVGRLDSAVDIGRTFLSKINPQELLYAPLKNALRDAWPQGQAKTDPEKIQGFWKLCEENLAKGVLTAGWKQPIKDNKNEPPLKIESQVKKLRASTIGEAYAKIPPLV
jgi:hypothetical protein